MPIIRDKLSYGLEHDNEETLRLAAADAMIILGNKLKESGKSQQAAGVYMNLLELTGESGSTKKEFRQSRRIAVYNISELSENAYDIISEVINESASRPESEEVMEAAITGLANLKDARVPEFLLNFFRRYTQYDPGLLFYREKIILALLNFSINVVWEDIELAMSSYNKACEVNQSLITLIHDDFFKDHIEELVERAAAGFDKGSSRFLRLIHETIDFIEKKQSLGNIGTVIENVELAAIENLAKTGYDRAFDKITGIIKEWHNKKRSNIGIVIKGM